MLIHDYTTPSCSKVPGKLTTKVHFEVESRGFSDKEALVETLETKIVDGKLGAMRVKSTSLAVKPQSGQFVKYVLEPAYPISQLFKTST